MADETPPQNGKLLSDEEILRLMIVNFGTTTPDGEPPSDILAIIHELAQLRARVDKLESEMRALKKEE